MFICATHSVKNKRERWSVCLTDRLLYPQPERLVIVDLVGRESFRRLLIPHLFSSYQRIEIDTMMR